MSSKNAWLTYSPEEQSAVMATAQDYMRFISIAKTERRFVKEAIALAEGFGYKNVNEYVENNIPLKPQDKVYFNMMDKSLLLFHIGNEPLKNGMNILGAHIDSPRLDIKTKPLYERDNLTYFDTHYYGGIKKYQWTALPLAIYGVIFLKDGTHMDIAIGNHPEDEVFVISDLLVHLSSKQMEKQASVVVEGENLDLIVGSIPMAGVDKDAVKANILRILKDNYGIDEEDFISAELEVVPQGPARTCGLDRSMVLAYGQDDKVCAWTSMMAQLETSADNLDRTSVCMLVDKEEIGSMGATGMQSRFFENQVAEVMNALGQYNELDLRRAFQNSTMLSNDVPAAHDPLYSDISSPNGNMAQMGFGLGVSKYNGSRGKAGTNDARAEYMAAIRKIFDDNGVIWQTAELGKVDAGGGGTIAYIMGNYAMDVVDTGVALQNMHAPFEISSKADIYEALKGYKAFIRNMKKL